MKKIAICRSVTFGWLAHIIFKDDNMRQSSKFSLREVTPQTYEYHECYEHYYDCY